MSGSSAGHVTVLDVPRTNECCPPMIVQVSDCKRVYVYLNTSFHYSMICVLSLYHVFLERVPLNPCRSRSKKVVTVHSEKRRIPNNNLENIIRYDHPLLTLCVCSFILKVQNKKNNPNHF